METYGRLKETIKHGEYYKNLFQIFQDADHKYNSGLFDFQKDLISKNVNLDNKIIKTIVNQLYYPESPYEFSVLPVEILGNAYEQFLGKQIKVDSNHKAKIEEKPEVRKAGGVYYTPQYIVDYIVNKTVGKVIEGKKLADISKIKIVDPACGSGSFLIGAYQFLLDWHKNFYSENGKPSKGRKDNPLTPEGNLTTAEKKRILLNNIYGVDIDTNAVEVTKLSLLLKCMEGETDASIATQMRLFNDRVLPTLDNNVKSGNSLIDTDFYDTELDFAQERLIKPFNWKKAFPDVFKQDGFNVVIGNPPWGAEFQKESVDYIKGKYVSAKEGTFDSYAAFVEKSINLLKKGGLLGFIVPDTFLRKDDFNSFLELLLEKYTIKELIETGPVFSQVRDTWCCVFCIEKNSPTKNALITHKKLSRFIVSVEDRLQKFGNQDWDEKTEILQSVWQQKSKKIIGYKASEQEQNLINKFELHPRLGTFTNYRISRGEEGSKFNIKESPNGDYFMVIPENIERYFVGTGKSIISKGLTSNKIQTIYTHPKIWIIRIQKMRWFQRIVSTVDIRTNAAGMKTLQSITSQNDDLNDLFYLQAILASKLINFWCVNYLADDINQSYLSKLPIKKINSKNEKQIKDDLIRNVVELMSLQIDKSVAKLETKKEALQTRIDFLEERINKTVYNLYELSEEEIMMVENSETRL